MNRHSIRKTAGLAYALALVCSFAAAACASAPSSRDDPPHMTVKFADLNLSTREGIDTLYKRIRGAARAVCDESESNSKRFQTGSWGVCYNTAIADAVAKVNNSQLTLRHAQSTGRHVG